MNTDAADLVRVMAGDGIEVQLAYDLLEAAEVASRVVGDNLSGGLGAALPGSVELWVHRRDLDRAGRLIAAGSKPRPGVPHAAPRFDHPTSDPEPDHSRGPRHGAPPHRPLPS